MGGNKILLTKNQDDEGYFYLFPGGGQEHGETIHNALLRECMEEVGEEVEIGELLHIREYIGKNHVLSSFDFHVHQVEYYFVCNLIKEKNNKAPTNPDSHQVGVEWIHINDLLQYRIYPKELRKHIIQYVNHQRSPVYLGDSN
ncbi:NUDIX domain-containing protein [Peribacillus frigoritolerans]|uniref:NUDIX domain-containing protein n=1 Tax=Peribacillus frigoritolerans TaxID=450367 RepID=UPI002E1FA871|nr:NUDIX domain-containing protein [Peribacillus frigoritolerans]MED4695131.1 NUDIX domain-containing protein [Peribacillus frigoritolerans]